MEEKRYYMTRALELAAKAAGYTNPNPMVGCVVVKDGRIISEGYHERCGEFHAERNALTRCMEDCTGADLYVTLEPCCHYGKTPPCTEIIMEKKIGRVFVGAMDSNPLVGGKGVQILRDHGIEVETGIMDEECRKLNEIFFHYIQDKRPFVVMKYAMSLDGKIACASGDSKWVTDEQARGEVQELRKLCKGIMVGIGTVLADDPMLNCRIAEDCDPIRIVCDSKLRIPMDCKLVQTAGEIPTIVACAQQTFGDPQQQEKIQSLQAAGVEVIPTDPVDDAAEVNLDQLMGILGAKGIDSILLEGGGTLNASALQAQIVTKVVAYVAPKIIGGQEAPSPVRGIGADLMKHVVTLEHMEITQVGPDLKIVGYPVYPKK